MDERSWRHEHKQAALPKTLVLMVVLYLKRVADVLLTCVVNVSLSCLKLPLPPSARQAVSAASASPSTSVILRVHCEATRKRGGDVGACVGGDGGGGEGTW